MKNYNLSKLEIESLIPHAGTMSFIDKIISCDPQQLICQAIIASDNPLLTVDKLDNINTIEFAGQAIALHCALVNNSDKTVNNGYLAAIRDADFFVKQIDVANELLIEVVLMHNDLNKYIYSFTVESDQQLISQGTLIVVEGAV